MIVERCEFDLKRTYHTDCDTGRPFMWSSQENCNNHTCCRVFGAYCFMFLAKQVCSDWGSNRDLPHARREPYHYGHRRKIVTLTPVAECLAAVTTCFNELGLTERGSNSYLLILCERSITKPPCCILCLSCFFTRVRLYK